MKRMIALALLMASVPATAAKVEVADGEWGHLPSLEQRNTDHLSSRSLARIQEVLLDERKCTLPGQRYGRAELTIPFAVQYSAEGQVSHLLIKRLGCPEVESILAGVLLDMVRGGDYRPTSSSAERWYKAELSFELATS